MYAHVSSLLMVPDGDGGTWKRANLFKKSRARSHEPCSKMRRRLDLGADASPWVRWVDYVFFREINYEFDRWFLCRWLKFSLKKVLHSSTF